MTNTPAKKPSPIIVCALLALITLALYWPVTQHAFVDFDDDDYITDNAMVRAGLTWPGLIWAFTNTEAANWHPVTWLSHMVDCQFFGLHPGAHHLVNVGFHIANTLLLFTFLRRTTGALWRSAFVAALFAWHPLRVESVAWAAERKDVLCAFFWLLTLLAYARYAARIKDKLSGAWKHYTLALVFFALALLSKPMAVTLPFVLILLDVWPLNRLPLPPLKASLKPLLLEKLPFLALSLAASAITYFAQKAGGAVSPIGFAIRWMNAVEAYPRYLSKMIWPMDLSIVYPYRSDWPVTAVIGAALLLVAVSILTLRFLRQAPWFFTGWFWFLGALIPVIGLVQVGAASMADRYTYIPEMGLAIIVAWSLEMAVAHKTAAKQFVVSAAAASLVACLSASVVQIGYWRDSVSLFLHAIAVTQNNYVAANALGKAFERSGQPAKAMMLYQEAVRIEPGYSVSQFNLATELMSFGQRDAALPHFQAAARTDPQNPTFQFDLGLCWLQSGQPAAAAESFEAALRRKPDLAPAQFYLGEALLKLGRANEALPHYREALRLKPNDAANQAALQQLLLAHPELH
jgi:tetratricopeptide (TPR) repeat protein